MLLIYTKRQCEHCDNSAMTLVILFSLKTVESLENGLQPQSGDVPTSPKQGYQCPPPTPKRPDVRQNF